MGISQQLFSREDNYYRSEGKDNDGSENHPANKASSKGADVGPVKHELALIVVLLLC